MYGSMIMKLPNLQPNHQVNHQPKPSTEPSDEPSSEPTDEVDDTGVEDRAQTGLQLNPCPISEVIVPIWLSVCLLGY